MKNIGLFYGSTTGNTEEVAGMLAEAIGKERVELIDVANASIAKMMEYDRIILASSTWGTGDLQDDWEELLEELRAADFSGKKIAFLGLGDAVSYGDSFVGGMGELYRAVKNSGAEFAGQVPVEDYNFEESSAIVDDKFVGLVIDQDNEEDKTELRIQKWISDLKMTFL
jgi:flavodoxin I